MASSTAVLYTKTPSATSLAAMPPLYQDSFSSSLRQRILLDRSRIAEWAEHEKEHIDVLAERYRSHVLQQQTALDAAATHYLSLKMQADCKVQEAVRTMGSVEELEAQAEERQDEISGLEQKLNDKQAAIRELRLDAIDEKDAVQSANVALHEMQASYQKMIEELQPILERYQQLGVKLEPAEQQVVRLVFTQIDPSQPDTQFCVDLTANDEDEYVVTSCEPALDEALVFSLVDELNSVNDGLPDFIRGMHQLFTASFSAVKNG